MRVSPDLYNLTESGRMLGLGLETMSDVVRVMGIETTSLPIPGRARYLHIDQILEIAERLGIEVKTPESVPA